MSPRTNAADREARTLKRDWNVAHLASTAALFATLYAAVILMKFA